MVGAFACPVCGSEVSPRGLSPGRQVRCGECGTFVEVPFLPRAVGLQRRKRRKPVWAWYVLLMLAGVLALFGSFRIWEGRERSFRERIIRETVEASEESEKSGHLDEALAKVQDAIRLSRTSGERPSPELLQRRDRLALREASETLALLEADRTGETAAALRELRDRVRTNPALDELRGPVDAAFAVSAEKEAVANLKAADALLAGEKPDAVLALCESAVLAADELTSARREPIRAEARALVVRLVARSGLVVDPIQGEFLDGQASRKALTATVAPRLTDALHRRGFLPRPEKSAFAAVWDEAAPYHLTLHASEKYDGRFFQSPLRTVALAVHVVLTRDGSSVWESRATGKTRLPPRGMSAYEAYHLAATKDRDPAQERKLYDDARSALGEVLGNTLHNLPSP